MLIKSLIRYILTAIITIILTKILTSNILTPPSTLHIITRHILTPIVTLNHQRRSYIIIDHNIDIILVYVFHL